MFLALLKKFTAFLLLGLAALSAPHAQQDVVSLFPIEHYNQNIANWIKPSDADYDKPLLTSEMQQLRMDEFFNHYFGTSSPWNADYVNRVLRHAPPDDLKTMEKSLLWTFGNKNKAGSEIGYGENFRPHTLEWIKTIADNINLTSLENPAYQPAQRGIAVDNTHVRALPTSDVHFYHYKIAGQGYPFDNLQMSAMWAGTPVYIISESNDHAWLLVLTPDFIGWVQSKDIARVNDAFVQQWTSAAKNKMAAITHTKTSLVDEHGQYLLTTYVGAVFPIAHDNNGLQLMVPATGANRQAVIKHANVTAEEAARMPLSATPHNFALLMQTLIGRPYGWGSMYFYNDCSQEMKSLFTPFAIWLPRHSSDQVTRGSMADLSAYPKEQRINYLRDNGHKLLSIVYIGGHVLLYIGNAQVNGNSVVMTYQDMWGLSPRPSTRRAVIGQSVVFPMMLQYPEDTTLISQADKKIFRVAFLDQMPVDNAALKSQVSRFILRTLMFPDFSP